MGNFSVTINDVNKLFDAEKKYEERNNLMTKADEICRKYAELAKDCCGMMSCSFQDELISLKPSAKQTINSILIARAFTVKQLIFHDPATIVFWADGTKTVVKCMPGEKFNKYHGFCAAVCKKLYHSNSMLNKFISEAPEVKPKKSNAKSNNKKGTKK